MQIYKNFRNRYVVVCYTIRKYLTNGGIIMVKKLKFIVIPLVLLPFFLIFLAVLVTSNSYLTSAYGRNAELDDISKFSNPAQIANSLTSEVYGQLKAIAKDNPQKLEEIEYLDELNKELSESNSYIVVRKASELLYCEDSRFSDELFSKLPDYWDGDVDAGIDLYIYEPDAYYIKQLNFTTSDEEKASIFILTYLGDVTPQFKKILFKMAVVIAMVLTLVSMFISWYMYWEFIRPINALKEGTNYIKDGNLEKDVEVMNEDEIGDLCHSFNEMRVKLKDSIDARIKYEQNNRELISNISHDLKTPITAIKGYVEGIMDGVADTPEKMDKYIKTIYNKTIEMDYLINELGVYSKLDNNAIPYNFRNVNVDSYFSDCIEDIQIDLESKGIELAYFNYCDKDVKIVIDPEQIRRVIGNIVINAAKYNDKSKGRLNIRLREVGDFVNIEIEDNGKGISEEDLPNIFNRTYRGDASRNSSTGGSGLGLSIAKKIIEEHGGQVIASSKLGVGTTINFSLKKYKENSDE